MADLAHKPVKPGAPKVGPRKKKTKGAEKIVEGTSGAVTNNSIGKATSVAGSRPYGRPITRMVYAMQPAGDLPYGGPVERKRIDYDQESY